ncbi:ATP-binding protein [Chloroflexota bacterium]
MNRLRTRLLISYIGIVLITLIFTALLLVLLLRNRPIPPGPILIRLAGINRVINERPNAAALLFEAQPEQTEQGLDRLASRSQARIIAGTAQDGIIYDSQGTLTGNATNFIQDRRPLGQRPGLYEGRFWEDGNEWLVVGQHIPTRRGEAQLISAEMRPASSWAEVIRIFGTDMLRPLLQAGLIALLLAAVLAWLSSRWISQPLDNLSQGAQAITGGDYHARVQPQGPEEVQTVGAAFNQMAAQVQATQTAQQDFLANISHDLRTPLTSIQGFSQAIIDGTSQNPVHHAQIIYDEAHRLNRLVGQLNDLSRVQAGHFTMKHAPINLGRIAERVVEQLTPKAQNKGNRLKMDIQPVPDIIGDGDRLAQVITNLIDNAIKFTPTGGTIQVAARPQEGGLTLTISDSGLGIPADDLPRIFERFYSVDKARGPERGSGLGLAITAEIVRVHGGRINVASDGPNQGTMFTCWFPALGMTTITRKKQ